MSKFLYTYTRQSYACEPTTHNSVLTEKEMMLEVATEAHNHTEIVILNAIPLSDESAAKWKELLDKVAAKLETDPGDEENEDEEDDGLEPGGSPKPPKLLMEAHAMPSTVAGKGAVRKTHVIKAHEAKQRRKGGRR